LADCSSWRRIVAVVEEDEEEVEAAEVVGDGGAVVVEPVSLALELLQRKAPIGTASARLLPVLPFELVEKAASVVESKMLPSGVLPAASLNAWQKTPD